jgi:hypothetical protein
MRTWHFITCRGEHLTFCGIARRDIRSERDLLKFSREGIQLAVTETFDEIRSCGFKISTVAFGESVNASVRP